MSIFKLVAGLVFNVAMYALLLFVPAGTVHWWRGWVFLVVTVVVTCVAAFNISSGLFSERARGLIQKGQPLWDRILVTLLIISYVGQVVLIPLDVFRLHFMVKPGAVVSFFGLVLYLVGWWVLILAMKINPFAVPVVRLQEERHQRVVDTGVYAVVRHPLSRRLRAVCRWPRTLVGILRCSFGGNGSHSSADGAERFRGTIFETEIERLRSLH